MSVYLIVTLAFLPVIIYMFYASMKVSSTFKKYNKVQSSKQINAKDFAQYVIDKKNLGAIKINHVNGNLTDNYNPKEKSLNLSDNVYNSSSIAALGVTAHELGHAVQDKEEYAPLKIRKAMVPVLNITSKLAFPLIIVGIILEFLMGISKFSNFFLLLGIICYASFTLFSLITLPVEIDASKRAEKLLGECNVLDTKEITGVHQVLYAAARTYLASFAFSLLQLIRLIAIFGNRRN